MIRLVLVDDQLVVRQGLRKRLTLEPDLEVVGEAGNGREAISLVEQLTPDVVLMDIEMPEMDGVSAAAMIRTIIPHSAVVLLSIHDDISTRARARLAGAVALIHKNGETDALIATIRRAAEQKET